MLRKTLYLISFVLALYVGRVGQAAQFYDDFNTPQDYLVDGVGGTGWDGFLGLGTGETVNALNASMHRIGELYIESTSSYWEGAFSPRGPFLYKVVEGDFIATVRITDFAGQAGSVVYHNDSFIMARVPNLDDAGTGEDFECMHYFPTWVGNMGRNFDNNVEAEWGQTGDGFDCAPYIQLERVGNTFHFRRSFDGYTWIELSGSSVTREDLDGLALQVGLAHSTYSGETGYVAFDDFTLIHGGEASQARHPNPQNEAADVLVNVDLSWAPGELVQDINGHEVYIGTDFNDVKDASRASRPNVYLYIVSDPCCDVGQLELNKTYFWRVDEVNEPTVWKGEIWSFTTETGKAINPVPNNEAENVDPNVVLFWTSSSVASSHDVYFGMDEAAISNASRPAGDIDGDGDVNWDDIWLVAQQWLLDPPVGQLPSADLNKDNDVDFLDWAILANDWTEVTDNVFKGNQLSTTFNPGALDEAVEYFWRIDEVNEGKRWEGDTWSFTTIQTTGYYYWPEYNPTVAYDYFDEYGEISPPTQVRNDVSGVAGTYADAWWCFRWGPDKNALVTGRLDSND